MRRFSFIFKYSQDAIPITVGRSLTSSFSTTWPITFEISEVAPSVVNHTPGLEIWISYSMLVLVYSIQDIVIGPYDNLTWIALNYFIFKWNVCVKLCQDNNKSASFRVLPTFLFDDVLKCIGDESWLARIINYLRSLPRYWNQQAGCFQSPLVYD